MAFSHSVLQILASKKVFHGLSCVFFVEELLPDDAMVGIFLTIQSDGSLVFPRTFRDDALDDFTQKFNGSFGAVDFEGGGLCDSGVRGRPEATIYSE